MKCGDNMDINKLSLKEKIGQKFMFGVYSENIDLIVDLIQKCYIGGVILYKKNYSNYDEMISVIKRLKNANSKNKIPLFIAIDQEGGRVNRMPVEFHNLKNVYDMSRLNSDLIYDNSKITGKMLSQVGINMNFAPVIDIYENDKSKVLYKRCFYGNVDEVIDNGIQYVKGLHENGVVSVVKHFPGHGISKVDSHFLTPYIRNYKDVLEKHILPFDKVIDTGVDAVMVGHLVIKELTNGLPASISSTFIDEYLRKRNNFSGLVVTDEMNMLARNIFYRFNYVKKMMCSGSDIILVKVKNKRDMNIINKYMKIISDNEEYMKLLDDSIKRIVKVKEKYNINDDVSYIGCNIDEINREIDRINKLSW